LGKRKIQYLEETKIQEKWRFDFHSDDMLFDFLVFVCT
jgi:hypothetical protein